MRNTNKKGFTIVELVIVVAVIAILAAVLIPTFSSIIRKANVSSDTVIAREINTIIAAENAIDEFEGFEDVVDALYANGFLLANLNTKTADCFFVWESKNNQILLVDAKDNFKVLFPETYEPAGSTWYLACPNAELLENYTLPTGINVVPTISDTEGVASFVEMIQGEDGGEYTLYLDNNTILDDSILAYVPGSTNDVVVNLELGNRTIGTDDKMTTYAIFGYGSNVTMNVNGGVITAANENTENVDTGTQISVQVCFANGAKATVNGTSFIHNTTVGGHAVMASGSTATFNNVTVKASSATANANGIMAQAGSTVVINDSTVESTARAIMVSEFNGGPSNVTINGGTYTGGIASIHVQGGSTVTVNGGTFVGDLLVYDSTLVINGGTFTVDPSAYVNAETHKVTENNGVWTVTAK